MKLLKCHIENFGKLNNFEFEFNDGLNIINEENGFGKTTFATFIKSMFYGLDASTNAKLENSERKLYMPWQGGAFGGNIEFEINGNNYRIERFFGKKQAEDTFKLIDLATNLESMDFSENIGEEIFKINKNGYERSTYIPQEKIQIEMEDSLNAKLSNILENDNDINTSESALNRLNETKKVFKKERGKGGLIDERKEKLFNLEREFENSKSDVDTLNLKKQKLENSIKEIAQIESEREEKQEELSKKIEHDRKLAKKETYQSILAKLEQAKEAKNNMEQFSKDRIDGIEEEIQNEKNNKDIEKNKIKKLKVIYRILLILGFVFLIIGIVFAVMKLQHIIEIILLSLGVIGILISFAIMYKSKNSGLKEIESNLGKLKLRKQEIEEQVNELVEKSIKQVNETEKEKDNFERENNIEELNNLQDFSSVSEKTLKDQINLINSKIDSFIDEKNQLKNQIEFLENKIDENEFIETDINNLKEEIEDITEKYSILEKTENLLREAKTKFSANYLKPMTEGFEKYFKVIDNKNMNTNIDINLNVNVDVNGKQKESKLFSKGYRDLIYICMRFGLIEALFEKETPFVILDDPFVNLDEEKTTKALEVLKEFSKKYQVIYFVCNSSRIN